MAGKRRKPAHRAIIYGGVIGGMTNARINELLAEVGERALPSHSYDAICKHYVPYFNNDMRRLGDAIEHPPTYSELRKAGQAHLPSNVDMDDDPADDE